MTTILFNSVKPTIANQTELSTVPHGSTRKAVFRLSILRMQYFNVLLLIFQMKICFLFDEKWGFFLDKYVKSKATFGIRFKIYLMEDNAGVYISPEYNQY